MLKEKIQAGWRDLSYLFINDYVSVIRSVSVINSISVISLINVNNKKYHYFNFNAKHVVWHNVKMRGIEAKGTRLHNINIKILNLGGTILMSNGIAPSSKILLQLLRAYFLRHRTSQ